MTLRDIAVLLTTMAVSATARAHARRLPMWCGRTYRQVAIARGSRVPIGGIDTVS
jgi:hypothetical protein